MSELSSSRGLIKSMLSHRIGAGRQHPDFDCQDEGTGHFTWAERRRPTQHLQ